MLKKQKIVLIILVFILSTSLAYASSSASYQTNDENINFGSNEGYMESSSYNLDLSDIPWIDRYSQSSSYSLVDANSDLDLSASPPNPPTSSGGGGGSAGPGGGEPLVYSDVPLISDAPALEGRELNVSEESVNKEPEVSEEPQGIQEPKQPEKPIQILRPSAEEVEKIIQQNKNTFIFTEEEPIIYYELDKKYDDYQFVQIEDYDVDPLKLDVPDEKLNDENGNIYIEGKTGSDYDIVSVWLDDDYIKEFYTLADENGNFTIKSSDVLDDGKYFIFVYALKKEGNKIIQTNYETVKFEIIDGVPYVNHVSTEVKKQCIRFDLLAIYIIIILTAIYSLWKKRA